MCAFGAAFPGFTHASFHARGDDDSVGLPARSCLGPRRKCWGTYREPSALAWHQSSGALRGRLSLLLLLLFCVSRFFFPCRAPRLPPERRSPRGAPRARSGAEHACVRRPFSLGERPPRRRLTVLGLHNNLLARDAPCGRELAVGGVCGPPPLSRPASPRSRREEPAAASPADSRHKLGASSRLRHCVAKAQSPCQAPRFWRAPAGALGRRR